MQLGKYEALIMRLYRANIVACCVIGAGMALADGIRNKKHTFGIIGGAVVGSVIGSTIGACMPIIIPVKLYDYLAG